MASKIFCKYFYSVLMVVECHSHGDLATIDIVQILSEFFFLMEMSMIAIVDIARCIVRNFLGGVVCGILAD